MIDLSPGQLMLDLVQRGLKVFITEESQLEVIEPVIEIKKKEPAVTEKKPSDSKIIHRNWRHENKGVLVSTGTFFRMLNYYCMANDGEKIIYLVSGLFLALICGCKLPGHFSVLVRALADLANV